MTSIRVNYKSLLNDCREFENKLLDNLSRIQKSENSLDKEIARNYTSYENWQTLSTTDSPVAKHKNLINFKAQDLNRNLIRFLLEMFPNHSINPSGHFLYPPGGYMSWHTNSDFPSSRVYITVVDQVNKSCFKYIKNESMVEDWDNEPIVIRQFFCSDQDLFWHAVYSECNRYSFGYRIYDLR